MTNQPMAKIQSRSRTPLIVSIVVGVLLLAAIVFLAYYLPQTRQAPAAAQLRVNPSAGLGDEGARCGGDLRLPCKPGNLCVVTDDLKREGVCVMITEHPAPVKP